jgi:hypothetical protein
MEHKYETPRIEDYGDVEEITAAQNSGAFFDANARPGFPVVPNDSTNTPGG